MARKNKGKNKKRSGGKGKRKQVSKSQLLARRASKKRWDAVKLISPQSEDSLDWNLINGKWWHSISAETGHLFAQNVDTESMVLVDSEKDLVMTEQGKANWEQVFKWFPQWEHELPPVMSA